MAVPVFGASGTLGAAASGTSITPALPAGITAGMLLIGVVCSKNNGTHTWPAGWNKVSQTNSGTLWTQSWAWRIATGSDSAPAVSWTGSVANQGQVWRYSGTDLTNPIGATSVSSTGTTSPHSSASITTTRDNSLAIYIDTASINTALTTPGGYASNVSNGSGTSVSHLDSGSKTVAANGTATGAISTAGGAAAWVELQIELLGPASLPPFPTTANAAPGTKQSTDRMQFPILHLRANNLDTWLWSYNLNLIAKDNLSLRHFYSVPRAPYRIDQQNTWLWQYNPNLIGQDQFPPGEVLTDRPPPLAWYRDWSQNLLQSTLSIPVVVGPLGILFNQYDWPLPRAAPQPALSWTWSYNLNLIGRDNFSLRHLWSVPRAYPRLDQTWIETGVVGFPPLAVPFNQTEWPVPRPHHRIGQTWAWSYNLNLIGKDQLPVGEVYTDRPPLLGWYRDWSQNLLQYTLTPTGGPLGTLFNQYDWPNPRGPLQPDRFLAASYNLNLIGQDALVTGKAVYELPPREYPPNADRRTWTWNYNLNLIGQDAMTVGKSFTDLVPRAYDYHIQLRSWTWSYNLTLIGQDRIYGAPGQVPAYDWPNPRDYLRGPPSWAAWYNLNLIGKDLLPQQNFDWPLPKIYAPLLQTWSLSTLLLFPPAAGPLGVLSNQYDWPNPRPYLAGVDLRNWAASYNLNLIARDQFPPGRLGAFSNLTPIGYTPNADNRTLTYYNANLNPPTPPPAVTGTFQPTPFGATINFAKAGSS